ncbi:hypothetical protein ABGN33_003137 [Yersinia enterocolitica]|nr:hypothetical protein [Yersinia enterocolitica]EKN4846545.1 hypothetical protein [Yersinia enterocolitica]EKN5117552.1 hypothetical protein [Yersinia enterocolitica]ELI9230038.1 hypothetical protein [Yersinia enterocolitica]
MDRKYIDNDNFITFLFDADHPVLTQNYNYATPCQNEFLKAVALVHQSHSFEARVRHGDVLIHNIASKPSKVMFYPRPTTPDISSWTSSMHQGKIDKRVLYTVINELKNDFSSNNTTIDLELMWRKLLRHNIYCLSLFPVDLSIANFIDEKLKHFPPYIGMADLDKSNQVHIQLFAELPDCGYFYNGTIFRSLTISDESLNSFGSDNLAKIPTIELPYFEYEAQAPIFPSTKNLAKKHESELSKTQVVMQNSHSEELAKKLLSKYSSINQVPFEIEFKALTLDQEHLKIPVEKLLQYILNNEHEKGKHKAHLFQHILGINSSQWRYLAYQLIHESSRAEVLQLDVTKYGIKYVTVVEVIGLNGRKATVKAAWKVSENTSKLVTAYPEEKSLIVPKENITPPPFIPIDGNVKAYWKNIFEVAHNEGIKSAKDCIPEPIPWQSSVSMAGGIEPEGMCGYAYIQLSKESDFAKWILRNKLGTTVKGSNEIKISAKSESQSLDREKAYADSFSKTLWLNGIDIEDIVHILS